MKENKRKIVLVISILLIITIFVLGLIYFKTNKINIKIQGTQKAYNAELQENEHMHLEEDASGDKVPVPNGYVGSKVAGENEIDTGYVIYEGEEEVTDENVEEAQKTRNQYVWVPVPDASKMYGTDANGKKWGKLYDFTTETGDNIDQITGAKPLNWSEDNEIIEISSKTGYREPDIISSDINSSLKTLSIKAETSHEFLIELEEEFNDMIESVEKYGGFYIGRYETGDLSKEEFVVKKGNTDVTNQTWYTMYEKCKKLYNKNANIKTGMIWGDQWDRTLMWLVESGNKKREEICKDSSNWGNYRNSIFEYLNSNNDLIIKNVGEGIRIPTGSTEYTKSNNIYDLAGNVREWTLEEFSMNNRVSKGGFCIFDGNNHHSITSNHDNPKSKDVYIRLPCNALH